MHKDSNGLHRLAELWDRECCLNNSWGGKPCEAPAADSPPAGAALLSPAQGGILDGYPWEIPGKGIRQPNRQTFLASLSASKVNYATTSTVTQEVKVCCTQLQRSLQVRETMAKFQSAFMVRIEDSWRPQSPAVSACVKHKCSVPFSTLSMAYTRCPVQYLVDHTEKYVICGNQERVSCHTHAWK